MEDRWTNKVRSFETNTIEEMEDALNEFFNDKFIISSPIMYVREKFVCMVYYKVPPVEVKEKVNENERASEKQIKYLKLLGYKGTTELTMTEAQALIKQYKDKNGKKSI